MNSKQSIKWSAADDWSEMVVRGLSDAKGNEMRWRQFMAWLNFPNTEPRGIHCGSRQRASIDCQNA